MIVVIDNYDSFTYNLVQTLGRFTMDIRVFRNDEVTTTELDAMKPSGIVISPGPGLPQSAGISIDAIRQLGTHIPILGVCLGHQAIGQAYGGTIEHAPTLVHGKTSAIVHRTTPLYRHLSNPFVATRYHSLVVSATGLPDELEVTARTTDNIIMGLRHKRHPVEGVQFHPESILTKEGPDLLKNWLQEYQCS